LADRVVYVKKLYTVIKKKLGHFYSKNKSGPVFLTHNVCNFVVSQILSCTVDCCRDWLENCWRFGWWMFWHTSSTLTCRHR